MSKRHRRKSRNINIINVTAASTITPQTNSTSKPYELGELLELYEQVNETHRYEGAGIWSRFNIIISLNIILFGILTFIISIDDKTVRFLLMVVSLSGALFSLWGMYVLKRLWLWHLHWKNTLQEIEKKFPQNFPTPFLTRPKNLKKSSSWFHSWILSYTQPFILILFFMWLTLFLLSYSGSIFKKQDTKEKTEIDIILRDETQSKKFKIIKDSTKTIK